MTIDISQLPIATEDDLQRVGQFLYVPSIEIMYRINSLQSSKNAIRVATGGLWRDQLGELANVYRADDYRLLTESQAIELAKTMPHVHEPWRATWPKEADAVPVWSELRAGDSFEYGGVVYTLKEYSAQFHSWTCDCCMIWSSDWWREHATSVITSYRRATDAQLTPGPDDTFEYFSDISEAWETRTIARVIASVVYTQERGNWGEVSELFNNKNVRNYRRAEPATTSDYLDATEYALRSMTRKDYDAIIRPPAVQPVAPEAPKHPGYANLGGCSEECVEAMMTAHNDAYARRQEQDKANILRQWRQPWSAGTNGLGSIACITRGRR